MRKHQETDSSLGAGRGRKQRGTARARYAAASRASLTRVRVYAKAPHGATGRRPTVYTGHRNKNRRGIRREGERDLAVAKGGRGGAGTSDSNYVELRADKRPIRGGFLAAGSRTP
jgi:hypothetical protein